MPICDCEVFEICPSCAPDEPTYAKAAVASGEAVRRSQEGQVTTIVDDLTCGATRGAHEFRNDARICECGETARPRKQAIAIDLDYLRELMREFLAEMQHRGHVTGYGPDGLSDWKFETFLQWMANRQRPPANLLHFETREEG